MRARSIYAILALTLPALCPIAETAHATATTHVWAPSTDVQSFKIWHITCDLYMPVENDASGLRIPTVTNVGLTVGILPFKKFNMELGFDHKTGLGPLDSYPLYGNIKVGIPENAVGSISPGFAIGVFDAGTKKNRTDYNVFYGKIAKTITVDEFPLGRFSLGCFAGNSKLLLGENGKKDNQGVLAAWERTVTEISDKLWICLEYMGTKSAYGSFNLGASWKFAPNVAVLGGYGVFNNKALVHTATLQMDIDI